MKHQFVHCRITCLQKEESLFHLFHFEYFWPCFHIHDVLCDARLHSKADYKLFKRNLKSAGRHLSFRNMMMSGASI